MTTALDDLILVSVDDHIVEPPTVFACLQFDADVLAVPL